MRILKKLIIGFFALNLVAGIVGAIVMAWVTSVEQGIVASLLCSVIAIPVMGLFGLFEQEPKQ